MLERYVVDDPDARPNFSLRIADSSRDLHLLYRGNCLEVRTPDPRRAVSALLTHLDAHRSGPPGTIRVHGSVIVRDGRAMLIPRLLGEELPRSARQLREAGVRVLDTSATDLDLRSGEVVVREPLDVDRAALDALAATAPRRADDMWVEPGRYPLVRWMFVDFWHEGTNGSHSFSRATAVRRAALTMSAEAGPTSSNGPPPFLELGHLFETVEPLGVDPQSPREVLDLLTSFP